MNELRTDYRELVLIVAVVGAVMLAGLWVAGW